MKSFRISVHSDSISDMATIFVGGLGAVLFNYDHFTAWTELAIGAVITTSVAYFTKEIAKLVWNKFFFKQAKKNDWKTPDRSE